MHYYLLRTRFYLQNFIQENVHGKDFVVQIKFQTILKLKMYDVKLQFTRCIIIFVGVEGEMCLRAVSAFMKYVNAHFNDPTNYELCI